MSKLEQLIEELCPDGVEYMILGDMCEISSAGVDKKIVVGEPSVKLLNYMDVYRNRNITQDILTMQVTAPISKLKNCNIEKGNVFITPTSETIEDIGHASVAMETIDGGVYSYHLMRLRLKELNMVTAFYMSYVFSSSALRIQILKLATGLTRFGLTKGNWEKIRIPLPPLQVQHEIVRILDTFSEYTTELTEELTMRKKQYEYYRDNLFSFDSCEYEQRLLGEIGEVRMCKRILKEQTLDIGDIPFYKIGTFGKEANAYISQELFEEYKSKYNYPKIGDVLISASGTIGRTVVFDGKDAYFQDSNIVWIENDESIVLNKYLFHFYKIAKWYIAEGGTIQRLYNDNLKKTNILVPYPNDKEKSLTEQQRIVDILDRFDTLCNDISKGLPDEIESRQKQNEYYRDKLLSFKEIS